MMSDEELVNSVKDKMEGFQILPSDLRNPTAKFVQSYFTRFLQELDIDVEHIQLPKEQLDSLTCPNAIWHVTPLVTLFGIIKIIAKQIYANDWTLEDLTSPSPSRTRYLIGLFDRFLTFADQKAWLFQENMQVLKAREEELEQLRENVDRAKQEMNENATQLACSDVISQEIEELKKKLVAKREQDCQLDDKVSEVVSTRKKLEHQNEKLAAKNDKVHKELSELRSKLVNSPALDQLESRLRILKEKNEKNKSGRQQLETTLEKKSRQYNMLCQSLSHHKHSLEEVHTIATTAAKLEQSKKRLQTTQEKLQLDLVEVQSLEEKLSRISVKIKELEEQRDSQMSKVENTKKSTFEKTEEAEKELSQQRAEFEANITKTNKLKSELVIEKEKLDRLIQLYKDKYKEYDELYEQKLAKIKALHEKLSMKKQKE